VLGLRREATRGPPAKGHTTERRERGGLACRLWGATLWSGQEKP
jgi:hypothetical protein